MRTLLIALLLFLPAQALAGKKGEEGAVSGNIAFYEEFVVVDPAMTGGQRTSFVKRSNTHLVLDNDSGSIHRAYAPQGFGIIIDKISYTLGESHATDDCIIGLYLLAVLQNRTRTSTGTGGTDIPCEHDINAPAKLVEDNDACTRSFPNNPVVVDKQNIYLTVGWTTAPAGTCDDILTTRIAISGVVVPPQ